MPDSTRADLEQRISQLQTRVDQLQMGNRPPRPLPEAKPGGETPVQKSRRRLRQLLDAEDARPEGEKQLWWNRYAEIPEMHDLEAVGRDLDAMMANPAVDALLPEELQGGPALKMWNTAQIFADRLYRDDPRPQDIARSRFDEHMIARIEKKARQQASAITANRIRNLPANSPRVRSAERRYR